MQKVHCTEFSRAHTLSTKFNALNPTTPALNPQAWKISHMGVLKIGRPCIPEPQDVWSDSPPANFPVFRLAPLKEALLR